MLYNKISFSLEQDSEENREILMAFIAELPFESFSENEKYLEAYSPINTVTNTHLHAIINLLPFNVSFVTETMPDINWNEEWEKNYFKPTVIGKDCLVRAPFHTDYPKCKYEVIINPNMAFGTGNHETTSLMINHISNIDIEGKTVLDMGCGTGILGIFASMKNCKMVKAIDIDEWAFDSVVENCKLNNISNINCSIGDADLLLKKPIYDIVLANIHKNIIIIDLPKYVETMKSKGIIVLSGFYIEDLNDILNVTKELSLKLLNYTEKNNWVAVALQLS